MSPETENSWEAHRLMVIDWHEQEVEDRKAIKAALASQITKQEDHQREVNTKLQAISETLVEIRSERKAVKWIFGVVVPIVLSALVAVGVQAASR